MVSQTNRIHAAHRPGSHSGSDGWRRRSSAAEFHDPDLGHRQHVGSRPRAAITSLVVIPAIGPEPRWGPPAPAVSPCTIAASACSPGGSSSPTSPTMTAGRSSSPIALGRTPTRAGPPPTLGAEVARVDQVPGQQGVQPGQHLQRVRPQTSTCGQVPGSTARSRRRSAPSASRPGRRRPPGIDREVDVPRRLRRPASPGTPDATRPPCRGAVAAVLRGQQGVNRVRFAATASATPGRSTNAAGIVGRHRPPRSLGRRRQCLQLLENRRILGLEPLLEVQVAHELDVGVLRLQIDDEVGQGVLL